MEKRVKFEYRPHDLKSIAKALFQALGNVSLISISQDGDEDLSQEIENPTLADFDRYPVLSYALMKIGDSGAVSIDTQLSNTDKLTAKAFRLDSGEMSMGHNQTTIDAFQKLTAIIERQTVTI